MRHRYTFLFILPVLICLCFLSRRTPAPLEAQSAPTVIIEAALVDGYTLQDADEAIRLRNSGATAVDLTNWQLSDGYSTPVVFPQGTALQPHSAAWFTGSGTAFEQQFGFQPDVVLSRWPGFANDGDEVLLLDDQGKVVDALVYEDGDTAIDGWNGPALQPYTVRGVFGSEGQVFYRMRDELSGLPVVDSDTAADWAQYSGNAIDGRRVMYPGWDLQMFYRPVRDEEHASLTVAIAPDNAFETMLQHLDRAAATIDVASLTVEHPALGHALVAAAHRGVRVRLLLEGGPVGGLDPAEKLICRELENAGGQCWFMINEPQARIFDRYQYMHAKYMIIDDRIAAVSSENLSLNSMPDDDKRDGTWGRRGVVLLTDAPGIVRALSNLFQRDLDPANHRDNLRWQADHPIYGSPPAAYLPVQESGGITYTVRYPQAALFTDAASFELQQAPENFLRRSDGILALVDRAGPGDILLIQQLQERPYWGASNSDPSEDPNLRLEAVIAAARRGAQVRLLLDAYFDESESPVSNAATCRRLEEIGRIEKLHLECRLANPTGLGIHNKMILARVNGKGYVQVGSWNGTELASKGNREVALLVQSDAAYHYLATMFEQDWPHNFLFPVLLSNYRGAAGHALISEVMIDPYGSDEAEFIEIANPMTKPIDLSDFSISDAVLPDDFEDARRFPHGALLSGRDVIVVGTSARDYFDAYNAWPDFEILETNPLVPNLIDDPAWGDTAALLRLGNEGDEVILRNERDEVVDVLTYGSGSFPEHEPCALPGGTNHSLERYPFWKDTDSCPQDFRDWPFPSPGQLP